MVEENWINICLILFVCGEIFDCNGWILVVNELSYWIIIVCEDVGDVDVVIVKLFNLVEFDVIVFNCVMIEMKCLLLFLLVIVVEWIFWEEMFWVVVNVFVLSGIMFEVGLFCCYLYDGDFVYVIGYVGLVLDYDLFKIEDFD